jgi:hypothetical protein
MQTVFECQDIADIPHDAVELDSPAGVRLLVGIERLPSLRQNRVRIKLSSPVGGDSLLPEIPQSRIEMPSDLLDGRMRRLMFPDGLILQSVVLLSPDRQADLSPERPRVLSDIDDWRRRAVTIDCEPRRVDGEVRSSLKACDFNAPARRVRLQSCRFDRRLILKRELRQELVRPVREGNLERLRNADWNRRFAPSESIELRFS